ncbi:hypothetical protein, partial [Enterobacter roggenkampii]|uniref:hypothetical protein n=1 Tax=Enterobacter roggenkampii TaxID=1812935 RepID=UPI001E290B26
SAQTKGKYPIKTEHSFLENCPKMVELIIKLTSTPGSYRTTIITSTNPMEIEHDNSSMEQKPHYGSEGL